MANSPRRLAALIFVIAGLAGAAPANPPATPSAAEPDAATILQRSQSRWQGLDAYQVPVAVSGSLRVAIISVPFKMTGTQYYQGPDKQALHLDNPPRIARGLGDTLSTMGTPQTWLRDYTIALPTSQPHGHHSSYVLTGTPKRASRVKTMTMTISASTYAIEGITFSYTNGATLVVIFHRRPGVTQYHLPRSATLTARFPGYSGSATIMYGDYQLNQPIPAAIFTAH
jgi:outer membrane lipoprotein-sorting protein